MISVPIERSRRDLAIKDINSNRPYLEIYVSKFNENGTDRKLRVRAFDQYHFHQIWTSPARDMADLILSDENAWFTLIYKIFGRSVNQIKSFGHIRKSNQIKSRHSENGRKSNQIKSWPLKNCCKSNQIKSDQIMIWFMPSPGFSRPRDLVAGLGRYPKWLLSGPIEWSRRELATSDANSNRPYIDLVLSKFNENDTDRKLRAMAFDWYDFHQIWTSPARDTVDSSLVSVIWK